MATLLPVAFHGDPLYLVEQDGEPFAPVKPICEAIGMDWAAQHAKLTNDEGRWKCLDILTVAADGKQRSMVCLPLRKVAGWLASISAAKVKPEIRDKLIAYQDECDSALWRYWTEGHAARPSAPAKRHASRPSAAPAQANLDLLPASPPPRRREESPPPGMIPSGGKGDKVAEASLRLESASVLLASMQFVKDPKVKRDLLTAAHLQCQDALIFITVQCGEVIRGA